MQTRMYTITSVITPQYLHCFENVVSFSVNGCVICRDNTLLVKGTSKTSLSTEYLESYQLASDARKDTFCKLKPQRTVCNLR